MPIYIFENERTKERKEIFQKMRDNHNYFEDSKDKWKRVWLPLEVMKDSLSEIDPYDSKAFVKKTGEKIGTYGDLMDASKELSDKRKSRNGGYDPIEQKYFENYARKRKGKKHKTQRINELKTSLDKKGIELDI